MDKILSYKVFNNNEDFVEWQNENSDKVIHQISPIPLGIGGGVGQESELDCGMDCKIDLTTCFGIFVLYAGELDW